MELRIRELESHHDYKEVLKSSCKVNDISCKILNGLTLRKMEKIYKRTLAQYFYPYSVIKIVHKELRPSGLRTNYDFFSGSSSSSPPYSPYP